MKINNQQSDMKKAQNVLLRPSFVIQFIKLIAVALLTIAIIILSKNWWLPWVYPSQDMPNLHTENIIVPRLDLNYPSTILVGADVRIVVTYTENGQPKESVTVKFIKKSSLEGNLDQIEKKTDNYGQTSVSYTPSQDGIHQILVQVVDKDMEGIVSLQADPAVFVQAIPTPTIESAVILQDSDNDGISDPDEEKFSTNPQFPDTDFDGQSDNDEINKWKTNPLEDNRVSINGGVNVRLGENVKQVFMTTKIRAEVFLTNDQPIENEDSMFHFIVFLGRVKKDQITNDIENSMLLQQSTIYTLDSNEVLAVLSYETPVEYLQEDGEYYTVRFTGYVAERFIVAK
jgi:hypothetical protein